MTRLAWPDRLDTGNKTSHVSSRPRGMGRNSHGETRPGVHRIVYVAINPADERNWTDRTAELPTGSDESRPYDETLNEVCGECFTRRSNTGECYCTDQTPGQLAIARIVSRETDPTDPTEEELEMTEPTEPASDRVAAEQSYRTAEQNANASIHAYQQAERWVEAIAAQMTAQEVTEQVEQLHEQAWGLAEAGRQASKTARDWEAKLRFFDPEIDADRRSYIVARTWSAMTRAQEAAQRAESLYVRAVAVIEADNAVAFLAELVRTDAALLPDLRRARRAADRTARWALQLSYTDQQVLAESDEANEVVAEITRARGMTWSYGLTRETAPRCQHPTRELVGDGYAARCTSCGDVQDLSGQ